MRRRIASIGSRIGRSRRVIRQVAEQSTANILIQGLGALTTLSFVHLLSIRDYALFGLCVLTASFIAIVSDLGLMASMGFFWREAVRGGASFPARYRLIRRIRLMLFIVSGSVGLIVLAVLQSRQGDSAPTIWLALAMVAVLAWSQINAAMAVLLLRLSEQLRRAYVAEIVGSVVRALLAAVAFALTFRAFWFPVAAMAATSFLTLAMTRTGVAHALAGETVAERAALRPVLQYVLRTMPGSLLFATQEMVVYGLASLNGGATAVAQAFALGRLSAIFVVVSGIVANVVIPRVVNMSDDSHAYRNGMVPIAIIALFCSLLIGVSAIVPDAVLFVLGSKYQGLQVELLLSLTMASLAVVAQAIGQFNRAMGWVKLEIPVYSFHALALVILAPFFSFDSARSMLSFGCVMGAWLVVQVMFVNLVGRRSALREPGAAEATG